MRRSVHALIVLTGLAASSLVSAQDASWVRGDTGWVHTPSGLSYRNVAPGTGAAARAGQSVTIHEVTTLTNGTVIFDSRLKDTPITFRLGGNQVIAGVEEGVTGMRVGGRRALVVPPALSRRASYPANTPRDSVLHIDVTLVAIRENP